MRALLIGGLLVYSLASHWRNVAKGGLRVGVRAGRKITELSKKAMSDIEDLTAEAVAEEDARQAKRAPPVADARNGEAEQATGGS